MVKPDQKRIGTPSRKQVRIVVLCIVGVLLFLSSLYGYRCLVEKVCESEVINRFVRHDVVLELPRGSITVEVVNTQSSRTLGLSGRSSMNDNEGMFFIFDTPGRYGFWMKDMKFPLDIIWINRNGVVVSLERNLRAESYPQTYTNQANAIYVLEINAGLAEKYGIYLGSKIKVQE